MRLRQRQGHRRPVDGPDGGQQQHPLLDREEVLDQSGDVELGAWRRRVPLVGRDAVDEIGHPVLGLGEDRAEVAGGGGHGWAFRSVGAVM